MSCLTYGYIDLPTMLENRAVIREQKQRLVFTNGCFDLLHVGHVRYLKTAREMGDFLVVAINSDASVRRLKGATKPVITQAQRGEVLASLQCVDFVFPFEENTPQRVIDAIIPDVLVKGGDWVLNQIVGRETVEAYGGTVVSVPLVQDISTTIIIQRIIERWSGVR